ncbi:MAG: response regulator [Bryobacteraceae bacterium]
MAIASARAAEAPLEPQKVKILLVDDSEENLVALEAVLECLGQDLIKANSGTEALRHLLEHEFAAILLDVKMPEMDGFETATLVRARRQSQHTPILFLTGYKSDEHLFRGYDLGAVDFLFKPIVPEILQSKVAVFVELSRNSQLLERQALALKKTEQNVRALLEAAPDAMVITDAAGSIVLVNTRTEALFGYRREELLKKPIHALVPEWNGESTDLCAVRAGAATFPAEISISALRTEDGDIIISSIRDATGRKQAEDRIRRINTELERQVDERTAELVRDVAIRQKTEQALGKSEERLRLAVQAAQLALWEIDLLSGEVVESESMAAICGLPPRTANCSLEDWTRRIHAEDVQRVVAEFDDATFGRVNYDTQYRVVRPDGDIRWLACRGQVLRDDGGQSVRIVGVAQDITERQLNEESVRHKQKLESLGILAGGIAHDFNNLLTGIMGNASLLLDDTPRTSRDRPMLQDIVSASECAAQLTRQMLAYSGRGRFVVEYLDLSKAVAEFTALLQASIPKHVVLRLNLAPELPLVEADLGQLQQLVMNLVINGAEAIGGNAGLVLVSTRLERVSSPDSVSVFGADEIPAGEYLLLEINDTGEGMEEATIRKIFDPFFTTKFTGRGLGLSAVLGIARGHKGAIKVRSNPGKGTTFQVFWPKAERQVAVRPPCELSPARGTGTILVVDDEEVVRRTAQIALERYGYQVISAENGSEALNVLEEMRDAVSLVVLDMTMPVMGGDEALRRMKRRWPELRVLASSGYHEDEAIRRFGEGFAGFIQKPYTAAKLLSKVNNSL